MEGRRLYRLATGLFEISNRAFLPTKARVWDYWKDFNGVWMCYSPAGIGKLTNHEITVHKDGTITVQPSILITGEGEWHGTIERGVWLEAA